MLYEYMESWQHAGVFKRLSIERWPGYVQTIGACKLVHSITEYCMHFVIIICCEQYDLARFLLFMMWRWPSHCLYVCC